MKTSSKIKITIMVTIFLIVGMNVTQSRTFREIFSWECTRFKTYEDFREAIGDYDCLGWYYFLKELPLSATEMEYYWYIKLGTSLAAYSMLLSEEDYIDFPEERLLFYKDDDTESEAEKLIYIHEEGEKYYIEDSELYDLELTFVKEVLHNPEAKQQYYFLIINGVNSFSGPCHNGIILNDETREVIEFTAEIMDEEDL